MSDTIKSYKDGIQARAAERQANKKPVFPDLGQVATAFDPQVSGSPVNIAAAGAQLQSGELPQEKKATLSQDTAEGLRAVYEAQQRMLAQAAPQEAPQQPQVPAPEPTAAADADMPEEFLNALKAMREEAEANRKEREAVAKRVRPMDLSEGLLTGEYTQEVPVVVGKLTVRYRSLTTVENLRLRELVHEYVKEHPSLEQMFSEILGFYQTVATLVSINSTVFPKHMASGTMGRSPEFSAEIFKEKVSRFMLFPSQLLNVVSTHSVWFAERVADLFKNPDDLKNG